MTEAGLAGLASSRGGNPAHGAARGRLAATFCTAVLVLHGCGFHLRTWDIGDTFDAVHIDTDSSVDLDQELAQAFRAANVRLVADPKQADVVVKLSAQRQERRSVSVTAGRAAEYEMSLQVSFGAETGDGEPLAAASDLRSERVARFDRDNVVGSSEEQALLAAEMRTDLVGRIVRVLGTLSRNLSARAHQDTASQQRQPNATES